MADDWMKIWGKKAAMVLALLVGVAWLVGGEENPGILSNAQGMAGTTDRDDAGGTVQDQGTTPEIAENSPFAPPPPSGSPFGESTVQVAPEGSDTLIDAAKGYDPTPTTQFEPSSRNRSMAAAVGEPAQPARQKDILNFR